MKRQQKSVQHDTRRSVLVMFLIIGSVACAACSSPSSAPSKPQYPQLAPDYSGQLMTSSSFDRLQFFTVNSVDEASDGGFIALYSMLSGVTMTLNHAIGHVKPFAQGKAPFDMDVLTSTGDLHFTGTVSQKTGAISGTVTLPDSNDSTATWTLTPSSTSTPTPST